MLLLYLFQGLGLCLWGVTRVLYKSLTDVVWVAAGLHSCIGPLSCNRSVSISLYSQIVYRDCVYPMMPSTHPACQHAAVVLTCVSASLDQHSQQHNGLPHDTQDTSIGTWLPASCCKLHYRLHDSQIANVDRCGMCWCDCCTAAADLCLWAPGVVGCALWPEYAVAADLPCSSANTIDSLLFSAFFL